ncbi:hypothetical protein KKA33_00220 [Patescibacteria group bacterium]|nr:hypothetical protein [Patescibacteria group bacterium]
MKIFLIILTVFITVDVLIVLYVVYRRIRRKVSEKDKANIRKNWKEIIRQQDTRHAIMDADKLLDHTLYLFGYKGNLGSKLKKANRLFKNVDKVWAAHKVRNNIAHQMNYRIDEKTYRNTMLAFKEAFKDLKIF